MLRFRIGRIPVEVQPGHFIMAALLGLQGISQSASFGNSTISLITWMAVVFVSVLFHEFGHAVVASAFGYRPSIQLVWTGGLTQPNAAGPIPWYRDVALTVAGPAFGFLLWALCDRALLLQPSNPFVRLFLGKMKEVNLFWSVFNLLPVLPMDGGRVAYAVLSRLFGRRGFLVAQILALVLSIGIVGLMFAAGIQEPFIIILFAIFGLRAFTGISAYLRGEVPEAQKNAAEIPLANAESLYGRGHLAEAKRLAEGVLETPAAGLKLRSRAHHLLGWIAIKEGQGRTALDHFSQVQGERLLPQGLAAGFSLIGDDVRALPLWELAYAETKDRTVLHEWAGALIRSGRLEDAAKLSGVELPLAYDCAERVLFIRGEFAQAAKIGLSALEQFPRPETAYDVACALARAGDLEGALRLLQRAAELGFRNASLAASDPDLASLRSESRFQEWLIQVAKSEAR